MDADWRSILQGELSFVENSHLEQYFYGTLLPEKSVLDANNFNETALKLVGQLIDSGFPEVLIDVRLDPSTNLCTSLTINSH